MPARFTQRLKTDRMDELILAISMSNKKQTGDYLKEFVDLINRHNETDLKIKKVKVLLSCFLQRHYIGTEAARQGGEIWKQENEAALMCLKNGAAYEISDWDEWVHHPHYEATLKEVIALYETNDAFRTIIGNLVKRHAPKADEVSAKNYLFEECTVFLLLKDAHVCYPSNELNAAVDFVTRYFETNIHYHGYAFYSKAEAQVLPRKAVKPSSSTGGLSEEEKAIKEEVLKLASRLESIGIVSKSKQINFFKKVLPSSSQEVIVEANQEEAQHASPRK
jgi:hypothetical protein